MVQTLASPLAEVNKATPIVNIGETPGALFSRELGLQCHQESATRRMVQTLAPPLGEVTDELR